MRAGCVTILEVARTLQKLINEGKLARPARTIRFIFPPEIEGTMALLNGHAMLNKPSEIQNSNGTMTIRTSDYVVFGPELAKRIKAVVHMDMVGGGPETKAVFPRDTRADELAEFCARRGVGVCGVGERGVLQVCGDGGKRSIRLLRRRAGRSRCARSIRRTPWGATTMCIRIRRSEYRRFI